MSENTTEYTPSQALECLDDISKNAIYNDMKDGTLTYTEKKKGKRKHRIIQGAELARVYGDKFKPENTGETSDKNATGQTETFSKNTKTHHENSVLQVEVQVLRERIKDKDKTISEKDDIIEDLRNDRDEWRDEAKILRLQGPQKPTQAANENSGAGVGGNTEKAVRGKNFAVFGGAIAVIILAIFLGMVFGPEIQNHLNGVGGLNALNPAAGSSVQIPQNQN